MSSSSSSTALAAQEYWGYLIKPDKSPTPVFEQLLLGVANYINHHIAPWNTQCLTPVKLAAFYRLVGGDYDPLFLDTSQASLSFIYQSLGCYHTIQPDGDPFTAPTTPALTPQGFVRWQTVQLLLEPGEHVPFLQEAVKRFDLLNPADGTPFPNLLPKEALPSLSDPDISEWHDTVSQKLMLEAQASAARNMPPRPQKALSDIDIESTRDSSVDAHSLAGTDVSAYFAVPRNSNRSPIRSNTRGPPQPSPRNPYEAPWSSERRRNSLRDNDHSHPASWPHQAPLPASFPPRVGTTQARPRQHVRADSDLSTISTSTSDSSITTSSASLSPVRYRGHLQPPLSPAVRRYSTGYPLERPASHPQSYTSHRSQNPSPSRQKNVSWQDSDAFDKPRYNPTSPGRDDKAGWDMRYGATNGRSYERGRGRTSRSAGPEHWRG